MNQFKQILLTAVATIGIFSTTMISCNTDKCKSVVCANNGSCDGTTGSCVCATGYEGTTCATQSLSKFLGTSNTSQNYSFNDASSAGCGTYTGTMTATRSTSDTTKLILTNLGGFGTSTYVKATVNGNNLSIATQTVTGSTTNTISGSGVYSNGVVSGTYTNNDGITTCTYTFTWTKI